MLTAKENLLECIRGGNPDRFVNQYEFIKLRMNHTQRKAAFLCFKYQSGRQCVEG